MAKKKNNNIKFWVIAVLILIALYGASQGWFKGMFTTINQETINQLETSPQQTGEECSITFSKSTVNVGDSVTGTIKDGKNTQCAIYYKYEGNPWTFWTFVTTDSSGYYRITRTITPGSATGNYYFAAICGDCVTNQETLRVNPALTTTTTTIPTTTTTTTIPGYDIGDVVGGSSGVGSLPAGVNEVSWIFDLSDVPVGGPYRLGAKIHTEWDYVDMQSCYHTAYGYEGVEWNFYDSDSWVWGAMDTSPQVHDVDLCPLDWDGVNNWKLEMFKMYNMPNCELTYGYSVEIYVCE